MKTNDEIETLKQSWRRDPCWDIEDTEGFEDHRAELKAYRENCILQWKEIAEKRHKELASKVCPFILFSKIRTEGAQQAIYENSKCLVEKCALWEEAGEGCPFLLIGLRIGTLCEALEATNRMLDNIANKMPQGR